ncbi:DUF4288 domain-containing protein [Flavobacterium stagni]|uniref:DUF4288 domain-containing protein n=1 Tax=Flavobacterium stagni TaxID=2506421 RepID=A0A4Q1K471_9FLAO|nr:DUF4288 domain-containing protein [Flavobacterium stagni]RXR20260.1 DUF4288 domain-containing protein [Flavobacterium stagni]
MEKEKIAIKNNNWYIVEIIEKCEPVIRNENQDLRRVSTWGNFHIVKAETPKIAYEKAVKIGKDAEFKFINSDKVEMEWIFVGIGNLIPIYEDIQDGSEIMWEDYGFISNRRAERFALSEKELLENVKLKMNKCTTTNCL